MEIEKFEKFPLKIVLLSNLHSLLIYILSILIIYRLGIVFSAFYLLFILLFEFRLIKYNCVNCFYWGKICGFGKGRLSSFFFKKGDASKFCMKEMTWKDMIPDLLILLIPLIIGIVLIILNFNYILLIEFFGLIVLSTAGNAFIRGSLTCKYCKQKDLGCPADALFNKK